MKRSEVNINDTWDLTKIFKTDESIESITRWCKKIAWENTRREGSKDFRIINFIKYCYLGNFGLDLSDFFRLSRTYTDPVDAINIFEDTWLRSKMSVGKRTHLLTIFRVAAVMLIGKNHLLYDSTNSLEEAYAENKATWPQYIIPAELIKKTEKGKLFSCCDWLRQQQSFA